MKTVFNLIAYGFYDTISISKGISVECNNSSTSNHCSILTFYSLRLVNILLVRQDGPVHELSCKYKA